MRISNQIGIVFLSVILLLGVNGIISVSITKGKVGEQDPENGEVLKNDGTKIIELISPRPSSEIILSKIKKNEEYDLEDILASNTDNIIIGSAVVDKDGKIIQYSIDTDDSELKRGFIVDIIFEPNWIYTPILIGLLHDPDPEVVHQADNALVKYTVIYYDYGENSPNLMRDINKTISKPRIKKWQKWYERNKDIIPKTIPMENRVKKYAMIAPTEEEIKQSEDKLLKGAKEKVNDPETGLITRAISSKILRAEGDYNGLQAILPELEKFRKLKIENLTFKELENEREKIFRSYKSSKERNLAKKQLINLIESSRESIRLKKIAILMALTMKESFTSSEARSLIKNVSENNLKLQLIKLLGKVGNINDVPFLLSLANSNNDKIKLQVLNTLCHMSLIQNWSNKNKGYVDRYDSDDSPLIIIDYALDRWTSWWEEEKKNTKETTLIQK